MSTHQTNQLHARNVLSCPVSKKLANGRIQMDFGWRPWLVEIVLKLAEGASLKNGGRRRFVPPSHEQCALSSRVKLVNASEEFESCGLRHPLVGDHQSNLLSFILDFPKFFECRAGGEMRCNTVVAAKTPGQRIE